MWHLKTARCWLVSKDDPRGFHCSWNLRYLQFCVIVSVYYCFVFFLEKPFYLKEVYLPTVCPDCLVVYEKIISGADTFTSHLLFSKKTSSLEKTLSALYLRGSVSYCLKVSDTSTFNSRQDKDRPTCCCGHVEETGRMPTHAIGHDYWPRQWWEFWTNVQCIRDRWLVCDFFFFLCLLSEICPESITPSEGLSALNSLFEQKMGHRVARLLDTFFDMFYNWFKGPISYPFFGSFFLIPDPVEQLCTIHYIM